VPHKEGGEVGKNWPILRDVLYGRPLSPKGPRNTIFSNGKKINNVVFTDEYYPTNIGSVKILNVPKCVEMT
jgi:hypothetical protein